MKGPAAWCRWGPNVYPEVPDGGWGWAVAAAFFLVEVCTYGVLKSLGVFLQDLMQEFGESNSRVSWVISICAFVFSFTAPLSTLLSNRFGCRQVAMAGGFLISLGTISSAFTSSINEMYITIGFVSGMGYCLTFLPTVTLLAQYFSGRRALVTAVASSGESFAIFAFAPTFTRLKEYIGWRRCLMVLGSFQASAIFCGLLLRPIIIEPRSAEVDEDLDKESVALKQMQNVYELENEQTRTSIGSAVCGGSEDSGVTSLSTSNTDLRSAGSDNKAPTEVEVEVEEGACPLRASSGPKLLDFSVLKDGAFIWYSLFGLFATLGFFAPQLYVIELSKSRGVEPAMASYMLSVMAVAEIFGRLSIGVVLNRVRCRKTLVLLVCVVLMCLVLVAFTVVWGFWGLVVCCAIYGYFLGTVGSTHIPMLAEDDVVGIQKMPSCLGVYVFIQSFAGLSGPPLAGVLVDYTQNYGAAFYSCAAGMGLSAVCLALVGPAKSGMCQRQSRDREKGRSADKEEDNDQAEFLDVDMVLEAGPAGPARRAGDEDNASYMSPTAARRHLMTKNKNINEADPEVRMLRCH